MIRKALTLSIIVIFSLLVVQSVWLYKVIINERASFEDESELTLQSAITSELDSRVKNSSLINVVNVQVIDSESSKKNIENLNHRIKLDSTNIGKNATLKLSMEQVFQDFLKSVKPLNLDTLSFLFSKELINKKIESDFVLTYSDSELNIIDTVFYESPIIGTYSFFEYEIPLNASKSMILKAKIYYPLFVYKGDFLLIGLASLVLLVFIVVAIVLQFKMLSRQITLAQLKENLTSFFTHELRSPLQSALSSIEMAEMYSEKSEVNNFLELSRNKVIYINRLIEKLLDINKLEKNKVNLIIENFPFMESISQYLNHYFNRSDKNIKIEPLFDPSLLIYGDKIHISNAMGNLIENAVKYSSDSVHIKIYAEENPHYITIIVEDNGIGIAPADQKRIFERFYRVKSAEHATKGKGFGLGLNYVKWVALSHKGDVKVESTPGKGSKFFFTVKKG